MHIPKRDVAAARAGAESSRSHNGRMRSALCCNICNDSNAVLMRDSHALHHIRTYAGQPRLAPDVTHAEQ